MYLMFLTGQKRLVFTLLAYRSCFAVRHIYCASLVPKTNKEHYNMHLGLYLKLFFLKITDTHKKKKIILNYDAYYILVRFVSLINPLNRNRKKDLIQLLFCENLPSSLNS